MIPRRLLGEEEFSAWLENPVTQMMRAWALAQREELKEWMATGAYTTATTEGNALAQAKLIGKAEVLLDLIQIELEDINQGIKDE